MYRLETFTEPKSFEPYPEYRGCRKDTIAVLDFGSIDEPIVDIVSAFANSPYCFPLQSCYGHFICGTDQDIRNLDPIPPVYSGTVKYRIAYIALCVENSRYGMMLYESLAEITAVSPAYIQFGSADWFWERFPNSYVLQVEPSRYRNRDEAILDVSEARRVQTARDIFFNELRNMVRVNLVKPPEL